MNFVNLTPHALNIVTSEGVLNIRPSGELARVSQLHRDCEPVGGIPTVRAELGSVEGLPGPEEGTVYIVSGMVASAAPREDVFSPGPLVRDEEGRVIGCRGLRRSC